MSLSGNTPDIIKNKIEEDLPRETSNGLEEPKVDKKTKWKIADPTVRLPLSFNIACLMYPLGLMCSYFVFSSTSLLLVVELLRRP